MRHIQEAAPVRRIQILIFSRIGVFTDIVVDIITQRLDLCAGVGGQLTADQVAGFPAIGYIVDQTLVILAYVTGHEQDVAGSNAGLLRNRFRYGSRLGANWINCLRRSFNGNRGNLAGCRHHQLGADQYGNKNKQTCRKVNVLLHTYIPYPSTSWSKTTKA